DYSLGFSEAKVTRRYGIFDNDERFTLVLLGRKLEVRPKLPQLGRVLIHHISQTTRPCDQGGPQGQNRLGHFFDILCLATFRTLGDCKLHAIAFFQGLVSIAYNRRIMDKHIAAGSPLNKPKSFFVIEPLDLALLFTHYPQTPFLQLQHATSLNSRALYRKRLA